MAKLERARGRVGMTDPFYAQPIEECLVLEELKQQTDQSACWQHVAHCFACLRNMGRLYLYLKQRVEQQEADLLGERPVPDFNKGAN